MSRSRSPRLSLPPSVAALLTVLVGFVGVFQPPNSRWTRQFFGRFGFPTAAIFRGTRTPTASGYYDEPERSWDCAPADADVAAVLGTRGESGAALVGIDVDDPTRWSEVTGFDLAELADRTAVVASNRGYHIYGTTPEPVATSFLPDGLGEIRGSRALLIAPPSLHSTSRRPYTFVAEPTRIAPVTELRLSAEVRAHLATPPPAAPAPGVEARGGKARGIDIVPPADAMLLRRADTLFAKQSPRFRTRVAAWKTLDASSSEIEATDFVVAIALLEAEFTKPEIASVILALSPKAARRGFAYAYQTINSAERRITERSGQT